MVLSKISSRFFIFIWQLIMRNVIPVYCPNQKREWVSAIERRAMPRWRYNILIVNVMLHTRWGIRGAVWWWPFVRFRRQCLMHIKCRGGQGPASSHRPLALLTSLTNNDNTEWHCAQDTSVYFNLHVNVQRGWRTPCTSIQVLRATMNIHTHRLVCTST